MSRNKTKGNSATVTNRSYAGAEFKDFFQDLTNKQYFLLLAKIAAVIFVIEGLVMLSLYYIPFEISYPVQIVGDVIVITLFSTPIIAMIAVRPYVMKWKKAARDLQESKFQFSLIIERSPSPIAIINNDKRIDYCNDKFTALFGWTEDDLKKRTMSWKDICRFNKVQSSTAKYTEGAIDEFIRVGEGMPHQECWLSCKDGEKRYIEFTMMPTVHNQNVIIINDVTDRITADESRRTHASELAHASRLSLIGELTAGMAHEINQPLTAICTYATASLRDLEKDKTDSLDRIKDDLEKMSFQAHRAAEIVTWVRGFSKKNQVKRVQSDLNDLIREAISISALDRLSSQVKIHYEFAQNLPLVLIDKTQMEQVVLNLVRNGIEAMVNADESIANQLTVTTKMGDQNQIEILVKDNGPGIDMEKQEKIFAPFFSTKETGMGMGLAITKSILEANGGNISLVSSLGEGTEFVVSVAIQ